MTPQAKCLPDGPRRISYSNKARANFCRNAAESLFLAELTTLGCNTSAKDGERIQTKVEIHTITGGKETRLEKGNEHLNTAFLEIEELSLQQWDKLNWELVIIMYTSWLPRSNIPDLQQSPRLASSMYLEVDLKHHPQLKFALANPDQE